MKMIRDWYEQEIQKGKKYFWSYLLALVGMYTWQYIARNTAREYEHLQAENQRLQERNTELAHREFERSMALIRQANERISNLGQ